MAELVQRETVLVIIDRNLVGLPDLVFYFLQMHGTAVVGTEDKIIEFDVRLSLVDQPQAVGV